MSCNVISRVVSRSVVVKMAGQSTVLRVRSPDVVLRVDETRVVIRPHETRVVVRTNRQGPPGPQGPQGEGILPSEVREDEILVGARNGANTVYMLPNGERAQYADPGIKIRVYVNGVRLHEGLASPAGSLSFGVSESGGVGTGYDTITLSEPLIAVDRITADYVLVP